jgi:phage baseplate assembly protein W
MLLLTIPGERVMDPNFGIGIQRFLFENDTLDLRNKISDRMRKQVEEYMPFIKIRETILPTLEDADRAGSHLLSIEVKYFIEDLSLEDVLSISISPYDSSDNVFGS